MAPIYAVGDIHGQKTMLEDAIARIDRDGGAEARVVFLGDYVDRGPDSCGVIETLVRGRAAGRDWIFLKGNHDRLFERFVDAGGPQNDARLLVGYHWLHANIGGIQTVESYGLEVPQRVRQIDMAARLRDAMPDSHVAFLHGLKLWHREPGLFFAHAGIRPGVPLEEQDEDDLLWIRKTFHDDTRDHGALIVHGHTPVETPERHSNRVNLDTGAGFGHPLTAAVFDGDGIFALTEDGRRPI